MWCQYSIVFPASVTVGYFRIPIKKWVSKLFHLSPVLFLLLVVASLVIFYFDPFWDTVRNFPYPYSVLDKLLTLFRPLYLIAALIGIAYCLDNFNRESRFLSFLGKYSFEMYLLHMPLMVSYDFILFRKPLYAFFLVFIASILVLGYGLNRISEATNQLFAKIVGGLLS
jgi:peptidoglycan/LPS O-acetylase OafA/YrhL